MSAIIDLLAQPIPEAIADLRSGRARDCLEHEAVQMKDIK
jgi:hypothetical protein